MKGFYFAHRLTDEIGGVVCRACEIEDMLNELDDAPTVIKAED